MTRAALAQEYNVSAMAIGKIIAGKLWRIDGTTQQLEPD